MTHNPKPKRRYRPPKLTVYGSLAELTKGGQHTRMDAQRTGNNGKSTG